MRSSFLAACVVGSSLVSAQSSSATSCSTTLTPSGYPAPSVASGYQARLVATGLSKPRGIAFDNDGNLLVVEQSTGITALTFQGDGNCLTVRTNRTVVDDENLNHGIELSPDGRTLYASSAEALFAYDYDPSTGSTSNRRTLVGNMSNTDHTTRTLLLTRKVPDLMLISRGSTSNIDLLAADITTGHSQIKAFNITNATGIYNYNTDGLRLGWGLRNSVGVGEHPVTGGIYSVENSVDQLEREGEDIHQNNPGEELNFHGYLNGTAYAAQGQNYGYPECFSAWNVSQIPDNEDLVVGDQFAIGDQNATVNDTLCSSRIAPRITFQAHMAPLDIKFNSNGTAAWVTFHGSWNRDDPVGYKLSVVEFSANGDPVEPSTSNTAAIDIMTNPDNSRCPQNCFRPVGLAFDSQGRLFMSSDATGEIYVVTRADANSTDSVTPTASGSGTGGASSTNTGSPAATTSPSGAGKAWSSSLSALGIASFAFCLLF